MHMLRNASLCGSVCLREKEKEKRKREEKTERQRGRVSERCVITVEVTGRRVAQRSVVALAVRAWMRLVLQFLQRTCPSRG